MKIEVGKSYRMVKNRESLYGRCGDIMQLEEEVVKVVHNYLDGSFRVIDKTENGHSCQLCNLEEIKSSKKLEKVLCIKNGFMKFSGTQFCTMDKYYKVTRDGQCSFSIIDDVGDSHDFNKDNNVWFKLIYEETGGLKVGDIVTAAGSQWLKGAYAKIVKIENKRATIEIIDKGTNKSIHCPVVGKTDDDWKLEWLVKVIDFKKEEQLKDNIEGDGIMKKGFKVGDIIRGNKESNRYNITDERVAKAKVICVEADGYIDIKILEYTDTCKGGGEYTHLDPSCFDLVESISSDTQKLEITTSGTTTKVKFEDGKEGVAKLYYKDTYNKGFGIVEALGKAMGIDLVGEVTSVVEGYKFIGVDLATDISKESRAVETLKSIGTKFKVGDIVRGIGNGYRVTNKDMGKASVIAVRGEFIDIKVLEHKQKNHVSKSFYSLNPKYFELVEVPSAKFEVGCKVKIPTTKQGKSGIRSAVMIIAEERDQDYLFLTRIDKEYCSGKDIYVLSENKDGQGDFFDLEDLELYEETPSLKKPILKEESMVKPMIFKVGDRVKVREDLIAESDYFKGVKFREAMVQYKGKIFKVTAVDRCYYTLGDIKWNWTYDMLELVEETSNFKVGDKVRIRKDLVVDKAYDNGCRFVSGMKKYAEKETKITRVKFEGTRFELSVDSNAYLWSPSMLEKIEATVAATEEKFKVGDRVYFIDNDGEIVVGIFDRIDGRKLFGKWRKHLYGIKQVPKTVSEFDKISLNHEITSWNDKTDLLKKLVLIDDTEPKIKVGDKVTKQQAIDIIESGGSIMSCGNMLYFKKEGVLKYKSESGHIGKSSGYNYNLNGDKRIVKSLGNECAACVEKIEPKTYIIGQVLNEDEAKAFIGIGGKIKENDGFIYWEKEGKLMFQSTYVNKSVSSGYNNIAYPAKVYELPKSTNNN